MLDYAFRRLSELTGSSSEDQIKVSLRRTVSAECDGVILAYRVTFTRVSPRISLCFDPALQSQHPACLQYRPLGIRASGFLQDIFRILPPPCEHRCNVLRHQMVQESSYALGSAWVSKQTCSDVPPTKLVCWTG